MAVVVADSTDKKGKSTKFVIGMQRPSTRSYWKIPLLNRGLAPVESEDPEVDVLIERCVNEKKTLVATYTYDALKLAESRRRRSISMTRVHGTWARSSAICYATWPTPLRRRISC